LRRHKTELLVSIFKDEISSMPEEKFESIKHALKIPKLQKALTLADQFWQFFREIANQQYHFNRANVEASVLRDITLDEVLTFYKVSKY
jgi:secreted Zn-dependent insulinase-like peptidase